MAREILSKRNFFDFESPDSAISRFPMTLNLNLFLQIIVITFVSLLTDKTKTNKSDFFKTALEYFIESVKEPFSKFFKSEGERIEILIMVGYGDKLRTHEETCKLFNQEHPIARSTVSKLVALD
jgi:hypothetical protein